VTEEDIKGLPCFQVSSSFLHYIIYFSFVSVNTAAFSCHAVIEVFLFILILLHFL
jgi:hypothetical protein